MSIELRSQLKTYFETGDKPTQAQMINLLDTTYMDEDMLRYKGDAFTDFANKIGASAIPLQPHLMNRRITMLIPSPEGTNPIMIGFSAISSVVTITGPTMALTNYRTQSVRLLYRSSATAGNVAHWRPNSLSAFWRGDAANRGGFTVSFKFSIPAQPSGYLFFAGMRNSSATPGATTEVSTFTDAVGIGKDSGDTTLQFLHNDNVSTCTKVDTGVTPSTDTVYQLIMHCESNGSTIYYVLIDLDTKTIVASHSATTNLPLNTTSAGFMRPIQFISNNAQAVAVDCETQGFYGEAHNN
jgi:hypothetical protein